MIARFQIWLSRPFTHKFNSLRNKLEKALLLFEDIVYEKFHGLNCRGHIPVWTLIHAPIPAVRNAYAYEAVPCSNLRTMFKQVKKMGVEFDNFVDVGSGKGKACFYAFRTSRFKKVIGIELSEALIETAKSNTSKVEAGRVTFLNQDATDFVLPDASNLVFLFNPFDNIILEKFLEKNISHFEKQPSVIAYINDKHRASLIKFGFVPVYRNARVGDGLYRYQAR